NKQPEPEPLAQDEARDVTGLKADGNLCAKSNSKMSLRKWKIETIKVRLKLSGRANWFSHGICTRDQSVAIATPPALLETKCGIQRPHWPRPSINKEDSIEGRLKQQTK